MRNEGYSDFRLSSLRAYPKNVRSQPRSAAEWRPNGPPLRSVPDDKRRRAAEWRLNGPPLRSVPDDKRTLG